MCIPILRWLRTLSNVSVKPTKTDAMRVVPIRTAEWESDISSLEKGRDATPWDSAETLISLSKQQTIRMSKMGGVLIASAANIPETRDTSLEPSIVSRDTKGGRRLWYCLRVIQQPERARACGSGPKSSADRRPVDPPPVVELRIYEGQTWEQAQEKDITFVYNANFFLFATLEHARVMAHARGTPAASNTPPVLTGMPVSGMAYLDRPQEAGYFLFPDLSVRHEGRYKLTFNLYEETKEDKDKDKALDGEAQPSISGLIPATGGSFDFRMEVKSQEFIVYSAKKFPGLAESTALSRVVAEQGCRVRIRRDVRMRRRDGKGGGDYDNVEDEYTRRRRTATPERQDYNNRARSMSGSTERTPYTADPQRRPSIADYPSQYPPNPPPGGHLQFLGGNASSQYPAAPPPQSFAQPPSVPASPVYPPPSQANAYPLQPAYAPPPPPPVAPKSSHSRERTPSQPGYPPINPAPPRRDSVHHDYRPQLPPLSVPPYHPPTAQQQQQQQQQPLHMAPPKPQALPSLQTDNLLASAGRLPTPTTTTTTARPPTSAPSLPTLMPSIASLASIAPAPPTNSSAASSKNGPLNPATLPPPAQYAGTKRAHDQSFRAEAEEPGTRFQDGARDTGRAEDATSDGHEPMLVRRADGQFQVFRS